MANENLAQLLNNIGDSLKDEIFPDSSTYILVDIGETARANDLEDLADAYAGAKAIVPLKQAPEGLAVQVNGRNVLNYQQLDSGVAVPEWVAADAGMEGSAYHAHDHMILVLKS